MVKKILVIGATGVAGGAVIEACRKLWPTSSVVGTTSRDLPAEISQGLSRLLPHIDVSKLNWLDQVMQQAPGPYDFGVLAFARGPVGYPVNEVTEAEKEEAIKLSFLPLRQMEASGQFKTVIGFSSFHNLPVIRLVYGAMIPAKVQMELWASDPLVPHGTRYVIKSGAFISRSLRAVKALLTRQLSRRMALGKPDTLVATFGNNITDLQTVLLQRLLEEEGEMFGTDRLTEPQDISRAVEVVLRRPNARVITVVADKLSAGDSYFLRPSIK